MNGIQKGPALAWLLLTAALLVVLDARDASAGTEAWASQSALVPFRRVGTPYVRAILGVPAVMFDGAYDAYRGPGGARPRTGRWN